MKDHVEYCIKMYCLGSELEALMIGTLAII